MNAFLHHPLVIIAAAIALLTTILWKVLAVELYPSFEIVIAFGPPVAVGLYVVYTRLIQPIWVRGG